MKEDKRIDIYRKIVLERHLNLQERNSIKGTIDRQMLHMTICDLLIEHSSIPIKLDDTVKYRLFDGLVIEVKNSHGATDTEFREIGVSRYAKVSENRFLDIKSAVEYFIEQEFHGSIDEIPIN